MFGFTGSTAPTTWRRNPCPQRNLPGHRDCVVCDEHRPAATARTVTSMQTSIPMTWVR